MYRILLHYNDSFYFWNTSIIIHINNFTVHLTIDDFGMNFIAVIKNI